MKLLFPGEAGLFSASIYLIRRISMELNVLSCVPPNDIRKQAKLILENLRPAIIKLSSSEDSCCGHCKSK